MMIVASSVSYDRSKVIDFSSTMYEDYHSILFKVPELEADIQGIMKPFNLEVRKAGKYCKF